MGRNDFESYKALFLNDTDFKILVESVPELASLAGKEFDSDEYWIEDSWQMCSDILNKNLEELKIDFRVTEGQIKYWSAPVGNTKSDSLILYGAKNRAKNVITYEPSMLKVVTKNNFIWKYGIELIKINGRFRLISLDVHYSDEKGDLIDRWLSQTANPHY